MAVQSQFKVIQGR